MNDFKSLGDDIDFIAYFICGEKGRGFLIFSKLFERFDKFSHSESIYWLLRVVAIDLFLNPIPMPYAVPSGLRQPIDS